MRALTIQAWLELAYLDILRIRGFRAMQRAVTQTTTASRGLPVHTAADIAAAVNRASTWYFKAPLCLQRAAVTTRLLRRHGVEAEMLIGYQMPPMSAHAWVEVAGRPVYQELHEAYVYGILDRW
jgi:hypothetical protein